MNMQYKYMDIEHGLVPWACSIDLRHWHAEWTYMMDKNHAMQHGHGYAACIRIFIMDMQRHELAARS
jgi:hypothetical protein